MIKLFVLFGTKFVIMLLNQFIKLCRDYFIDKFLIIGKYSLLSPKRNDLIFKFPFLFKLEICFNH